MFADYFGLQIAEHNRQRVIDAIPELPMMTLHLRATAIMKTKIIIHK
ncbi:MAG: hypothetical protein JWR19_2966 [Pedosphaera sp.]|nr:hypothetical protein [Pedosphaera sp.]